MAELSLRPLARRDLAGIWSYSAERWSVEQADSYLRLLHEAMLASARAPQPARRVDEIRSGYRVRHAGAHLIFFQVTGTGIDVVRILHERMEPTLHL